MDLSFIILSWNSAGYLAKCVESILKSCDSSHLNYEILILDNGSTDDSVSVLKDLQSNLPGRIRGFFEPVNTGTTRSRNRLIRAAQGCYLCVMDSDVELHEGVIETLIGTLRDNPDVGLAVPLVRYGSGRLQKSTDRFPTIANKIHRFFRLRSIEAAEALEAEQRIAQTRDVDYAISAFWITTTEVVERVGLLDEKIFYAPEDVDFCLRVWRGGYRIVLVPSVWIVHHCQEISRGFRINKAKVEHIKGLIYFFRKHGYAFRRPEFSKRGRHGS